MTSDSASAAAEWTLDEACLLSHRDPERKGESLQNLIERATRWPRPKGRDDVAWMMRRSLGSGLLEESQGRFFATELLASLRLAAEREVESLDEDDEADECGCDEGPGYNALLLKGLQGVPVRESDWDVSDRTYRRARRRVWWSRLWFNTFVHIPAATLVAAILIIVLTCVFVWRSLRWVASQAGRLLGRSV